MLTRLVQFTLAQRLFVFRPEGYVALELFQQGFSHGNDALLEREEATQRVVVPVRGARPRLEQLRDGPAHARS